MRDDMKSNMITIVRIIREAGLVSKWYCSYILLYIIITGVVPVILIYIPKLIVDAIVNKQGIHQVILYIVIITVVSFLHTNLKNLLEASIKKIEYEVSDNLKQKLGSLVMNMKFIHLETPEVLDKYEKAYRSLMLWSGGLETLSRSFMKFAGNIISLAGILLILNSERLSFSLCLPVFMLIFIYFEKRKSSYDVPFFSKMVKYNREFNYYTKIMKEITFGKEIRLYDVNPLITDHTDAYQVYSDEIFIERARLRSKNALAVSIAQGVFQALMYLYLTLKTMANSITLGSFVLFSGAYSNFITTSLGLFWNFFAVNRSLHFFRQFFEFIVEYEKELEKECENQEVQPSSVKEKNCIEFCNVWFRYNEAQNWILQGINVKLYSNEKVSIVGKNGAGKTTFIKLLAGLYQPSKGMIKLNGTNIKRIPKEEYYSILSTVFQDFQIYAASIKENIVMSETFREEAFWKALRDVNLEEHINRLPEKENTSASKLFDEEGVDFSGGQKQRLAIARAIYHKSHFIILDEPTSALDPKTEYEIYHQVQKMERDKGIIFISHRLSSCKYSDRVVVFENGSIVQEGSHEELIVHKDGQYYELYMAQAHHYIEKSNP